MRLLRLQNLGRTWLVLRVQFIHPDFVVEDNGDPGFALLLRSRRIAHIAADGRPEEVTPTLPWK